MIFGVTRQILVGALTFGIAASALILTSCSTTETRISKHPEIYQSLSPRDQALVSQGQIRAGMPVNAVWVAWGSPAHSFFLATPSTIHSTIPTFRRVFRIRPRL